MITIRNLKVAVDGKEILKGIDLTVKTGEVHAIMGPNGSGKSTLAHAIAGGENYEVTDGTISYKDNDLLDLSIDERARAGIFLAFQYPVEVPGVNTANFLKTTLNKIRKGQGKEELDAIDMLKLLKEKMKIVDMDEQLLRRSLNEGFSGGEKKRCEIFQMAVLEPSEKGVLPDILKFEAVSDSIRISQKVRLNIVVTEPLERPVWYKIITDIGQVHLEDGEFVFSSEEAGECCLSLFATNENEFVAESTLRISVK